IGFTINKVQRGIHYIENKVLPMQFIDNRKLHIEDNIWLKGLSKKLDPSILLKMGNKSELYEDYPMMYTYIKGVTGANIRAVEEAKNMKTISDTNPLVEVWTEMGLIAKLEALLEAKLVAKLEAELEAKLVAELEAKLVAEWEAKLEAKGEALETKKALGIAQNMLNLGFSPETVASATMLDLETVKNLPAPAAS
ncbi:MAG: hypothetical protein FWG77_11540, partial [Treponema sp.]|nr:hypothetical protein [Treponema sp.]